MQSGILQNLSSSFSAHRLVPVVYGMRKKAHYEASFIILPMHLKYAYVSKGFTRETSRKK
jgi:hypothetical protein